MPTPAVPSVGPPMLARRQPAAIGLIAAIACVVLIAGFLFRGELLDVPRGSLSLRFPDLSLVHIYEIYPFSWKRRSFENKAALSGKEKGAQLSRWCVRGQGLLHEDEISFIEKHKTTIYKIITELPGAYGKDDGYLADATSPIRIAKHKDGLALYVGAFGIDTIYNTRMSTERQAAAKVLSKWGLPRLDALWGYADDDMHPQYVSVSVYFWMRDFVEAESTVDAHAVTITAKSEDVRLYSRKEITDQDLLERSTVLLDHEAVRLRFE